MRRPGPLKELPLDLFLPNNVQSHIIFKPTPNKRPVCPDPVPLSPAKRRILNEELFFSPERTPRASPYGRKLPRPALDGPGSPARKLHFGLPEQALANISQSASLSPDPIRRSSQTGSTKTQSSSASKKLAPSPEFKMKTRSSHRRATAMQNDGDVQHNADTHPSSSDASPVTVPRDLPSLPDRHSVHHPGFDVHQDPHIFLSYGPQSAIPESGKDVQKENAPPRKKSRRVEPGTPSTDKGLDVISKLPSMPHTPRKKHAVASVDGGKWDDGPTTPTPRRPVTHLNHLLRTPMSTPLLSKVGRKQRKRRMLEEELDDNIRSGEDGDDRAVLLF